MPLFLFLGLIVGVCIFILYIVSTVMRDNHAEMSAKSDPVRPSSIKYHCPECHCDLYVPVKQLDAWVIAEQSKGHTFDGSRFLCEFCTGVNDAPNDYSIREVWMQRITEYTPPVKAQLVQPTPLMPQDNVTPASTFKERMCEDITVLCKDVYQGAYVDFQNIAPYFEDGFECDIHTNLIEMLDKWDLPLAILDKYLAVKQRSLKLKVPDMIFDCSRQMHSLLDSFIKFLDLLEQKDKTGGSQ